MKNIQICQYKNNCTSEKTSNARYSIDQKIKTNTSLSPTKILLEKLTIIN